MKSNVFKDPGLKLSATRVVFIVWCAVVLFVWTLASIFSWKLVDIPTEVVTILGLLAGVKATQRFTEGKTDPKMMIEMEKLSSKEHQGTVIDSSQKETTPPNPGTSPDCKKIIVRQKDPISPDKEQLPTPEVYDVKPRVIVKVKDIKSIPDDGFSASKLFSLASVKPPEFTSKIMVKRHFEGDALKAASRRFQNIKGNDKSIQWPNLEGYLNAVVQDEKQGQMLAEQLRELDTVETAYLHPGVVEPPMVYTADDPLSAKQSYLDPAPAGIDARHAWTVPGGDGKNLKLADVEWGWNLKHEDLEGINFINVPDRDHHRARAHGTKVLGVIAARDNTNHCVGITPNLPSIVTSGQWNSDGELITDQAIMDAILELNAGDVLLLEAQTKMFGETNIPLEAEPLVFDVVELATYYGIVVVAAAGNGGVDLNQVTDSDGLKIFDRDIHDSGAIIVGSAYMDFNTEIDWHRLNNSCYGSRVDCFASGDRVVTLSSDYEGTSLDEWSNSFSSTSSATAIVAGAALALQSAREEHGDPRLSSHQMRERLSDPFLNTKSKGYAEDQIGVMPNLLKLISR